MLIARYELEGEVTTGSFGMETPNERRKRPMPTIAYFLGITVRMHYNDHEPPHVHVRYQGYRARALIADGSVLDGRLPPTTARLVKEWIDLRRDALMQNWRAARNDEPLERVEGLE